MAWESGESPMEPQTLKSEVPQSVEKHHHDSDREKYEDDNPNHDAWDRSECNRYNEGDLQTSSDKADDGKEDAENVSAACLSWLQRDMRK